MMNETRAGHMTRDSVTSAASAQLSMIPASLPRPPRYKVLIVKPSMHSYTQQIKTASLIPGSVLLIVCGKKLFIYQCFYLQLIAVVWSNCRRIENIFYQEHCSLQHLIFIWNITAWNLANNSTTKRINVYLELLTCGSLIIEIWNNIVIREETILIGISLYNMTSKHASHGHCCC